MTTKGKIVLTLLILGVLGFGVWKWLPQLTSQSPNSPTASQTSAPGQTRTESVTAIIQAVELAETQTEVRSSPRRARISRRTTPSRSS